MSTAKKSPIQDSVEHALGDLEAITDEIRVKLHLASMDANVAWNERFEPKLHEARSHARDAKTAVDEAVKAFKEFAASL